MRERAGELGRPGSEPGDNVTTCLIVNADDYAMSPGVSRGILEAHARGVVTSTTALVNTPGAKEALAAARAGAPALGLGLHVNLSFGRPVLPPSAVPSLVGDEGHFFSGARLLDAMKDESGALGLERLVPSALLGLILSAVCWRSGSLWPSLIQHVCHNAILLGVGLSELGSVGKIPWPWLAGSALGTAAGALLLWQWGGRAQKGNEPCSS